MKLIELFEDIDRWGIYGGPPPERTTVDGTQSPLTWQGDASWKDAKDDIYSWFKLPFLTNGPSDQREESSDADSRG